MPDPDDARDSGGSGDDLGDRIRSARAALEPEERPNFAEKYNSLTLAWRMTLELVAGCAIGFGIGWGLDAAFGTRPLFMIVFGLFGFAAGVKVLMETANKVSRGDATRRRNDGDA